MGALFLHLKPDEYLKKLYKTKKLVEKTSFSLQADRPYRTVFFCFRIGRLRLQEAGTGVKIMHKKQRKTKHKSQRQVIRRYACFHLSFMSSFPCLQCPTPSETCRFFFH
ncbi:hypothetical protein CWD84_03500 [Bacillus siamensis]|uniref:Uncharacterized protein n=1 Tax=Bacillus siamensis TaxID=659243 RepID=A0AAI8MZ21_9BACI|nr:hypothetical protein CWD84_03500 [Bacillus siamensis]